MTTQYFFGFASAFSGQVLYDPVIYQLYNMTMTTFPILWFSVFDFEYEKAPPAKPASKQSAASEE